MTEKEKTHLELQKNHKDLEVGITQCTLSLKVLSISSMKSWKIREISENSLKNQVYGERAEFAQMREVLTNYLNQHFQH